MRNNFSSLAAVAVIALLFAALTLTVQGQREGSTSLKAAMDREVLGDLAGAIEAYRKIADGKDRALAAQALVRMAACYRKLGDAEARKLYEQVTRDFSDQKDAVAEARTGLAAMGPRSDVPGAVRMTVVSDTTNLAEDGEPAVPYATPYNPRWTTTIPDAIWIWKTRVVTNPLVDESHRFTKTFFIEGRPISATLQIAADNDVRITINDSPIAPAALRDTYSRLEKPSVAPLLREGRNTISFLVTNIGQETCNYPPPQCNAAGLLYRLDVDFVPTRTADKER